MTGPTGNSEFCSPLTPMFPAALPRETLRVSGKQSSVFPFGQVSNWLLHCINPVDKTKWSFDMLCKQLKEHLTVKLAMVVIGTNDKKMIITELQLTLHVSWFTRKFKWFCVFNQLSMATLIELGRYLFVQGRQRSQVVRMPDLKCLFITVCLHGSWKAPMGVVNYACIYIYI